MVTARRSVGINEFADTQNTTKGGVGLLERKVPASYAEFTEAKPVEKESIDEARERMQRNLDRLLNYDKPEVQKAEAVVASEVVEEVQAPVAFSDEDIRPTSTTMQFGDGDIDQMYKEMNRQQSQEEQGSYRLNGKGKLAVVLYSLAVAVILALIFINTGVLASLSSVNEAKAAELSGKEATLMELNAEIESISDKDYIISLAENQYGMIKG